MTEPENARRLMAELFRGAIAAHVVEVERDNTGSFITLVDDPRQQAFRGEQDWALALVKHPRSFLRTVEAGIAARPAPRPRANLVRRLRDLARKPTQERLRRLCADAARDDANEMDVLGSALRWAARRTVYEGRRLPARWLDLITAADEIKVLAQAAHELLTGSLPGRGRIRDHDLERYCSAVAQSYQELTGKVVGYAKATGNVKRRPPFSLYGDGLNYMLLAMRLIDGAVDAHGAQREIDRIRRQSRR